MPIALIVRSVAAEEVVLGHERAVDHQRETRAHVEQEPMLDRCSAERRERGRDDRVPVGRELNRKRLARTCIPERLSIVQPDRACLVVELQHELLDELAADDAVDLAAETS